MALSAAMKAPSSRATNIQSAERAAATGLFCRGGSLGVDLVNALFRIALRHAGPFGDQLRQVAAVGAADFAGRQIGQQDAVDFLRCASLATSPPGERSSMSVK
jgi:hypothetical protein